MPERGAPGSLAGSWQWPGIDQKSSVLQGMPWRSGALRWGEHAVASVNVWRRLEAKKCTFAAAPVVTFGRF
jgi:hypothetical protein